MRKSERIRRLEGMLDRMAQQNGRDKRELAKERGDNKRLYEDSACLEAQLREQVQEAQERLAMAQSRIKELEAERAKAREPWRPPATEPCEPWICRGPVPSASWQCWPLLTRGHSMAYATPTTTADDIEKAYD